MDSENPFRAPSAPGTPLRQLSTEQMNQQRIPQSPSLHSYLAENDRSHHRSRDSISSDVQGKVAFLNTLSNPSSPTRPPRGIAASNNAAFQRAVLGYEESQASLATAKADLVRLQQQVESGARRERMVSERIESLMEQLSTSRESRESDKKAYVTEMKKSRRQGYQAEMAAMEAREELREIKSELKKTQAELDIQKRKKEEARQEAFERAYAVSGLTEEAEMLKQKMKAIEKERDAAVAELRANAIQKQENMLMMERAVQTDAEVSASEPSRPKDDTDATTRASKRARTQKGDHVCSRAASTVKMPFFSDWVSMKATERHLDGDTLTFEDHIKALYDEVRCMRQLHTRQEATIHFMNMQCQFQACPCRDAEREGTRFIHDHAFDQMMQQQQAAKKQKIEEDQKFRQLPPIPTAETLADAQNGSIMEEAVQIPLPSPKPTEVGSKETTPEPTALLEEMTQVLVEPAGESEHFKYSTRSEKGHRPLPPPLRHAHSATDTADSDLFNFSPPKSTPARPATALGVSALKSPIRMVPGSPQTTIQTGRSSTPQEEPPSSSRTMRVALKDSSPTRSHRRTQSRPNIREQAHTRSPLAGARSVPDFNKSTSASPAASTVFPVTPKHSRSQTHHNIGQMVTTTTTIPLRGMEVDEDEEHLSHTPGAYAHTQPIDMPAHPSISSAEQLVNVPGTPVSREAALAQIRARRDRARSVNLKKDGGGIKSAPGSARRGIALRDTIERGREGRDGREVSIASMASAPGRI